MDQHISIRGMQLKDQQSFSIPPSNPQKGIFGRPYTQPVTELGTRTVLSTVSQRYPTIAQPRGWRPNISELGPDTYRPHWGYEVPRPAYLGRPDQQTGVEPSDMFLPEQRASDYSINMSPTMPASQSYVQPPNQNGNIWETHSFLQPGCQGLVEQQGQVADTHLSGHKRRMSDM